MGQGTNIECKFSFHCGFSVGNSDRQACGTSTSIHAAILSALEHGFKMLLRVRLENLLVFFSFTDWFNYSQ